MIRVNYIRDGLIEESHLGYVYGAGIDDHNRSPYYIRSCAKPLQATLLIENDLNLLPEEIALCSGSHSGEDCHIKTGTNLLKKFGLNESDLKCGIHEPLSKTMRNKMLLSGEKPSLIHNNCSGKHIGFLALCVKNNWSIENYYLPNHPLQKAVEYKIKNLCEVDHSFPVTTDGCGVPIQSMPLKNLVTGFINLKNYPQIINAIRNNPYMYGGEDRTDTEIIQKTDNLIAKVGAGGLCVVLNYAENEAFAVKIEDCSYDARKIAVFEIINKLGWGNIQYDNRIKTLHGKTVGSIEVEF